MTDQKTTDQEKPRFRKIAESENSDQRTTPTMSKNKTTMTGAGIFWECLEREVREGRFWLSWRRHSASL